MSVLRRSIAFAGFVQDGFGIALWQADGSGPEPAATGHTFITQVEPITAHYYVASRDHVDVSAHGGMRATGLQGGWPRFQAALATARRDVRDLIMRLPLTTAGPDREGEDWFFRDGVETRFLRAQAPLPVSLQANALLGFAPLGLVLTEDYRNARDFSEVKISLVSDPIAVRSAPGALDGPFAGIVEGALADFAGRPVRLVVDAIQLSETTFSGHGRTNARFAEIPMARVEIV